MRKTRRLKCSTRAVALLVAVAAVVGCAAMPAAASDATADKSAEHRAVVWTDAPTPAQAPSLTNEASEPHGGTGSQLGIGLSLIGLGVVGLASALAVTVRKRDGGDSPGTSSGEWPATRGLLARARS